MSVTFHTTRDGKTAPIASLSAHDIECLNASLDAHAVAWQLSEYEDTKLLDTHIDSVLSLPKIPTTVRVAFERMQGMEVVYAIGE
ncbi:MAG: hypothetical protein QNJ20_04730 [Paracoccaceae bacterium]|nr:hypothetical protein [Paracoccaceae bacterium]